MKTIEKIIIALIIVLLAVGLYVCLRNIDFFNIGEIEISVSGPVTNVSVDIQRVIMPIKGRNIFEVSTGRLEKTLESFDGVKTVKVSRYYPSKLVISIVYNDISAKAYSVGEDSVEYYFIHDYELERVSSETWESFDQLAAIELNPAYAQMTMKWGADIGFASMVELAKHLGSNNLISSIKYDNNNGSDFGRLAISLSSINSVLYVRELVGSIRLAEALDVIADQPAVIGTSVIYDLYANTLVKRT